jgi:hypothetical protein
LSEVEVTGIDRLPWDLSRRQSVDQAIRTAVEGVPGGPWVVTVQPPAFPGSEVSISVRGPRSMLLTSVTLDATPAEIGARLASAMQTSP